MLCLFYVTSDSYRGMAKPGGEETFERFVLPVRELLSAASVTFVCSG